MFKWSTEQEPSIYLQKNMSQTRKEENHKNKISKLVGSGNLSRKGEILNTKEILFNNTSSYYKTKNTNSLFLFSIKL